MWISTDGTTLAAGIVIGLLIAAVHVPWWKARYTRAPRRDAGARSAAVTTGKGSELLPPFLPEFPFPRAGRRGRSSQTSRTAPRRPIPRGRSTAGRSTPWLVATRAG